MAKPLPKDHIIKNTLKIFAGALVVSQCLLSIVQAKSYCAGHVEGTDDVFKTRIPDDLAKAIQIQFVKGTTDLAPVNIDYVEVANGGATGTVSPPPASPPTANPVGTFSDANGRVNGRDAG